jgi:hypothetical protein
MPRRIGPGHPDGQRLGATPPPHTLPLSSLSSFTCSFVLRIFLKCESDPCRTKLARATLSSSSGLLRSKTGLQLDDIYFLFFIWMLYGASQQALHRIGRRQTAVGSCMDCYCTCGRQAQHILGSPCQPIRCRAGTRMFRYGRHSSRTLTS